MANPKYTPHKLYARNKFSWKSVSDAIEGSNAVKRMNELYLPMPQGFADDDRSVSPSMSSGNSSSEYLSSAPHYHHNKTYMAYLHRARFPEITINTLRGLVGISTRKSSYVDLPEKMEYLIEHATNKKQSLDELFVACLIGVLMCGRVTLVVDINEKTNEAHIVLQDSPSFLNWLDDSDSGETLLAVFEERVEIQKAGTYETEEKTTTVVYCYEDDEEGATAVTVKKLDGEGKVVSSVVPSLQGIRFEEIPVITIGSLENGNDPDPAPLLGVSEIAYSIYRKDADLSNAQYMTCNPMFCISGATGAVPTAFGSTVALILDNPAANAFFPATDTSALDHVQKSIDSLREEAAVFGATLLGASNGVAESTETLKTRQGAQGATLVGAVNNVAKGITDALKIIAKLHNIEQSASYEVSTDFAELTLSAGMLTALIGAIQAGVYSKESLIGRIIESGFAQGEVEDELTRIATEGLTPNIPDKTIIV